MNELKQLKVVLNMRRVAYMDKINEIEHLRDNTVMECYISACERHKLDTLGSKLEELDTIVEIVKTLEATQGIEKKEEVEEKQHGETKDG